MKVAEKKVSLKDGREVVLKSITSSDAELMLQHLIATHLESYRNMNQTAQYWKSVPIEEEKKILADFEKSKSKAMIAAWFENKIIGGASIVGQGSEFVKHNASLGMSIQKAFAGQGLGSEMMKYLLAVAKEAGFHRIDLTVRTYNVEGIALYEKTGFQKVGLLKDVAFVDGKYVDEFLYQRILG
jgi:RimJ/RimL family protein N-acetyltransferase